MIAYHGEPQLKAAAIARMREHRETGVLIRGYGYWGDRLPGVTGFHGCAVGCLVGEVILANAPASTGRTLYERCIGTKYPEAYERYFGIPGSLAQLEERVFEYLEVPDEQIVLWPERFLEAIPVGADLASITEAAWAALTQRWDGRRCRYSGLNPEAALAVIRSAPVPGTADAESATAATAALEILTGLPRLVTV